MRAPEYVRLAAKGIDPRTYKARVNMRYRCTNSTHPSFHNYGGRGISICQRWDSFDLFAKDMGPHPGKGWTLERKKNDKGYCGSNCKWATRKVQGQNTRKVKLNQAAADYIRMHYTHDNIVALMQKFGIARTTLSNVVNGHRWI